MPNPFVRRQAVTSKTDVDRPTIVTPVMESVRGHVFAYRGMETHGVDPNNEANDPEDYGRLERGVFVDYETEEPDPEPIPVRVVEMGSREFKRFRTTRATSGPSDGNAVCILGTDPLRRKVVLKNTTADVVYIGHDESSVAPMHGWPLAQNETLAVEATSSVYAKSSTVTAANIAMFIEYVIVDD